MSFGRAHEEQIADPAAADIEAALAEHPDVSAVLIIAPTEYGTGADVRGIAEIATAATCPCWSTRRGERTSIAAMRDAPGGPCAATPCGVVVSRGRR
ncbi:hypothetical protein [Actinoplanes utahensis]|uniref:Uncharacterized protein n=1 Tax=Actinoplanes utahensis TaxID=1869 RepID=A0A0A6UPQ7_ACTUT|nr:hypothetical protein [Actinoplanes utahensis]KHD78130.1 hypothetical protein MB27_06590 [Actinoplanes utahensis]GIF30615.1 hypothetical protein Aut01nite_36010 [Actinoplanes utahensis]